MPDGEDHQFLFENIIVRQGALQYILSDRWKMFQSELVTDLLKIMGLASQFRTSYHPQPNGLTKRLNKTIADSLAKYTNNQQTNWTNSYLT